MIRRAAVFALLATSIACVMPSAGPYEPVTKEESELLSRARRDLLPDAVRSQPELGGDLVAWTGVLSEKTVSSGGARFVVDHHYWDWVVDFGTQSVRIFLSPFGEGVFRFDVAGDDGEWLEDHASEGDMLIVYGVPVEVDDDGVVALRYAHARGIPQSLYSTEVWDYGRGFAVHGQGAPSPKQLDAF